MFERMSASFALARSSWNVLMKDKRLIAFPIISGFFCLLILVSFAIPFIASEDLRRMAEDKNPLMIVFLFLFYLVSYFVVIFFNSALVSCALMRFNGEEPTLEDGLRGRARLPQIFAWAMVSATVGLVLKLIENANERIGQIVSAILGTAWTVMTFFVVPVLVVEKAGPVQAVSRSIQILKRTWGEALLGNFGIGFFCFLLMIPGILLAVAGGLLCAAGLWPVGLVVIALAVIYLIIASAANAALHGIFVGALYQYAANGQVPEAFDGDTLARAFKGKAAA